MTHFSKDTCLLGVEYNTKQNATILSSSPMYEPCFHYP